MSANTPATGPGTEIVVRRSYPFPAERVYDAWLDPVSLGQWLFATPAGVMQRVEVDPRVGGEFLVAEQRGEILAEHFGRYLELDRPRRLVFEFTTDRAIPASRVEITIVPTGGGCDLTLTHSLDPQWLSYAEKVRGGWTTILESLDKTLSASANTPSGSPAASGEVHIVRTINAPRELVFAAWTDPSQLANWFAPRGCSIEFRRLEIVPGGTFHSCIRTPDGHQCWCMGEYREVDAPQRLVFTMKVADAEGNFVSPTDAGMDPEWPAETVVTVRFEADGRRTRLTLDQNVSEALAKRTGAHPSWLQMLDLMEEQLPSAGAT